MLGRVIYCNRISQLYRIQSIVGYYVIIPTNVWNFIIIIINAVYLNFTFNETATAMYNIIFVKIAQA